MSYCIFGGEFPGEAHPRLFTAHILLVPGDDPALIAVHLFFVVLHKHTQYPGRGGGHERRRAAALPDVRGEGGRLLLHRVRRDRAIAGAACPINPVWNYVPRYDPSPCCAGPSPTGHPVPRRRPAPHAGFPEIEIGHYTLPLNIIIPAMIVPGILFTLLAVYPWIEAWATGDRGERACAGPSPNRRSAPRSAFAPDHVLHPGDRGVQRHHRYALPHVAERHHVGVPGADLPRPVVRVLGDQAHLPRAAAQGP